MREKQLRDSSEAQELIPLLCPLLAHPGALVQGQILTVTGGMSSGLCLCLQQLFRNLFLGDGLGT